MSAAQCNHAPCFVTVRTNQVGDTYEECAECNSLRKMNNGGDQVWYRRDWLPRPEGAAADRRRPVIFFPPLDKPGFPRESPQEGPVPTPIEFKLPPACDPQGMFIMWDGESHCLHDVFEELKRFRTGKLRPEELQNICHNLGPQDKALFFQGCDAEQMKLFGTSAVMELQQEISELKASNDHLRRSKICIAHFGAPQQVCPVCELEDIEALGTPIRLWERAFLIFIIFVCMSGMGTLLIWAGHRIFR